MISEKTITRSGFTRKRCTKCGGNIFMDRDTSGWFEQCLQCGRNYYLSDLLATVRDDDKDKVKQIMLRSHRNN